MPWTTPEPLALGRYSDQLRVTIDGVPDLRIDGRANLTRGILATGDPGAGDGSLQPDAGHPLTGRDPQPPVKRSQSISVPLNHCGDIGAAEPEEVVLDHGRAQLRLQHSQAHDQRAMEGAA